MWRLKWEYANCINSWSKHFGQVRVRDVENWMRVAIYCHYISWDYTADSENGITISVSIK